LGLSGASRTRNSDSILLESANYSGFSAQFAHTAKATAGTLNNGLAAAQTEAQEIVDIGLFYANGPVSAGLSQYSQKTAVKHTTAFASYTMGAVKVMAGMHTQDNLAATVNDTDVNGTTAAKIAAGQGKTKGKNIAVNYTMGATTFLANVARTNDQTTVDRDLKMTAIGVKYELSKRTSLNARLISEKRDNAGAKSYVASEVKTTLLGIQHNF
jgi:predicted porin